MAALLLGLNGIVVKSHGGTDRPNGFAMRSMLGYEMVTTIDLLTKINQMLNRDGSTSFVLRRPRRRLSRDRQSVRSCSAAAPICRGRS